MPNVSMNPSHHYTTQSSSYERLQVGKKLTDRRITKLKKQGWFGSGILSLERIERAKKKNKTARAISNFKKLMEGFGKWKLRWLNQPKTPLEECLLVMSQKH